MATYLLIHDPWIGAWSLAPLALELETRGHNALALDEPAGGGPGAVEDWAISAVRAARENGGNVVLVGHSRGGLVVNAAADLDCDPFNSVVHIMALVPATGWFAAPRRGLASRPSDPGAGIMIDGAMLFSKAGSASLETGLRQTHRRLNGFDDGPRDAAEARSSRGGRDGDHDQTLPCAYIECSKDLTFRSAFQRGLDATRPCDRIYYLDSDRASLLMDPMPSPTPWRYGPGRTPTGGDDTAVQLGPHGAWERMASFFDFGPDMLGMEG